MNPTPAPQGLTDEKLATALRSLGQTQWGLNAHAYFSHSGGRVSLRQARNFYEEATRLSQEAATHLFATRQTGGVDQAWVDKAMELVEHHETLAILYGESTPDSEREFEFGRGTFAARDALRAHLSTALLDERSAAPTGADTERHGSNEMNPAAPASLESGLVGVTMEPLSDEQIIAARQALTFQYGGLYADTIAFARAIEKAHGIGEPGEPT